MFRIEDTNTSQNAASQTVEKKRTIPISRRRRRRQRLAMGSGEVLRSTWF